MNIVSANLVDRFYVVDGWTREGVAKLLVSEDIKKVIPRWYDSEKDKVTEFQSDIPEDFCCEGADYFAVYNFSEKFKDNYQDGHTVISKKGVGTLF